MLLRIFGKSIQVELDDSVASSVLRNEISLYPRASADDTPDLEIRHGTIPMPNSGLVNPSTHQDLSDGFAARFGTTTVRWVVDNGELRRIDFQVRPFSGTKVAKVLRRMRSNQFTTGEDAIGQVFHELVLVPSVYFDDSLFLVHASVLQGPDGGVLLIGGTGGVGKTSLALELCRRHGFRFMADDIAVVDRTGHVWPNLAFPKIYGYNLEDDDALRSLVRRTDGWAGRLNWRLHRARGADRVRRRISPARLYPQLGTEGGPLRSYLFIARELRRDIAIESSEGPMLAALSNQIMDSEYHSFHNHLAWHQVNRLLRHGPLLLTRDEVLARWRRIATEVFSGAACKIIRAPRFMEHREFKHRLVDIVLAEGATK